MLPDVESVRPKTKRVDNLVSS